MTNSVNLVWFRRDLRVSDNPALAAAAADGAAVLPLFADSPGRQDPWRPAARSLERERAALARLNAALRARGSRLIRRRGEVLDVFERILDQIPVGAVYFNQRHEPYERGIEAELRLLLRQRGIAVHSYEGGLLFAPADVQTATGSPYRVFTPFWHACQRLANRVAPAKRALERIHAPQTWPASEDEGLENSKEPVALAARLTAILDDYAETRDRPDIDGTSKLSAALHFGEIGPRELWAEVEAVGGRGAESFLRQLAWREFAQHLLHHFPETPHSPMRAAFAQFPWRDDEEAFERWKAGRTGYPIVDAGMRQLAATGWMHNRIRMVTASFLVKHLLIDWRAGTRHFWEVLEDADLANNTLGWQWVAGSGADAAPYFRVFNPLLQARRFDPEAIYVRRWVPELAELPDRWIHQPWAAPQAVLDSRGLAIGTDYPCPTVELGFGRRRALDAYSEIST